MTVAGRARLAGRPRRLGRSGRRRRGGAADARGSQRILTERYADSGWRIVPSPDANKADNTLYAATVTGGDHVWAVGNWTSPTRGRTLTMRRCAG